jgi:hypothetical protein
MLSVIILEGLMVFHYDERTKICEIGILKADEESLPRGHHDMAPHIFRITPDPKTGQGEIPQDSLKRFKREGNIWVLDVETNGSGSREGKVSAKSDIPYRHDPNSDRLDFGWLIDVQKEFHPKEPLKMKAGALLPIIQLRSGRLYTCCKTDAINVIGPDGERSFGFIAECIGIGFDTYKDEQIVLKVAKTSTEVFRLSYRPEGHRMVIKNTSETEVHYDKYKETEHFQLYYELFFQGVSYKCHLKVPDPTEGSPNPCATEHEGRKRSVYPYKCGGIVHGQLLG